MYVHMLAVCKYTTLIFNMNVRKLTKLHMCVEAGCNPHAYLHELGRSEVFNSILLPYYCSMCRLRFE